MEQVLASNDAEQAVISSALLNAKSLNFVIERFVDADFYYLKNRIMFQAVSEIMKTDAEGVDLICVKDWLIKNKQFNQVGGDAGLVEYFSIYVLSARLPEYHKIVKDFARRRELDVMAKKISEQVNDVGSNLDDVIYSADDSLKEMRVGATRYKYEMSELMDMERLQSSDKSVKTGISAIDYRIYGLFDSELSVLAASTSVGKSSLALNIAENIAENYRVLFFSIEMPARALAMRMLSGRTGIEFRHIRSGNVDLYQGQELKKAAEEIKKLDLYINDNSGITVEQIRNLSIIENQEKEVKLIVIDYLQYMSSKLTGNEKYEHISRECKGIARELDCPVLLLSQLSRNVEGRVGKIPQLSDLRGSGAIGQDSDNVFFLYQDNSQVVHFLVAKARNNPLGSVELDFDRRLTKFRN